MVAGASDDPQKVTYSFRRYVPEDSYEYYSDYSDYSKYSEEEYSSSDPGDQ